MGHKMMNCCRSISLYKAEEVVKSTKKMCVLFVSVVGLIMFSIDFKSLCHKVMKKLQ